MIFFEKAGYWAVVNETRLEVETWAYNSADEEIILLDKVAKQKLLTDEEIKSLKAKKLIEGRKPNFHISSEVAKASGDKARYIKQRGIDDDYCMKIIIEYIKEFNVASRSEIEEFVLVKLPDILDDKQKKHKVKNLLQKLKRENKIKLNENRKWILDEI